MDKAQLNEVIRKHQLWLNGSSDGQRANLRGADLSGADLRGADLRDASLRDASLRGADLRYSSLSDANLRDASLRGANLSQITMWGCVGNRENILSIQTDTYEIAYTAEAMQIGCEQHRIKDWWKFTDEEIDAMDPGRSLEWWKVWRPLLKRIIKASPAKPTGYVEPPKNKTA